MSIEQHIVALTAALTANTQAILGNVGTSSAPSTATPAAAPAAAPSAPVALVPPAAAPHTPAAAAPPAAASPSSTAPPPPQIPAPTPTAEVSFDQLQQEVTAIYQAKNGDPRISEIVTRYGGALSNVAPEQYTNLLGELRALA